MAFPHPAKQPGAFSCAKLPPARRTLSSAYRDEPDKKGETMTLEWLKPILGDAYTEELDKKIAEEIGKNFVSRADFNAKNEELKQAKDTIKTHETQLEGLKAAAGSADELKAQITALQEQNKTDKATHEAELAALRMDVAVDKALTEAGAKNNVAAKALLSAFLADAKMGSDGTIKGLAAEIEALAKAEGTAFLFKSASEPPAIQGMRPGESTAPPPAAGTLQSFESRLAEARKAGNQVEAIAIKREAAESGFILT